jgi:ribosomal protein L32
MVSDEVFQSEANILARSFAPHARRCKECGHAYLEGYCCDFCGTGEPGSGRYWRR